MRIAIGIAIGITSYVVPMYISEISPARARGALVTLNQLMITIGILLSYITDYGLSDDNNPASWRGMFLAGFVPAAILLAGMFFLPETPRWLIGKGRWREGEKILMAGIVSNTASIIPAIIIGSVNVPACLFSVCMLDKVGRRKPYFAGIIGMIPFLALLGACFHFKEELGSNLPVFAVLSIVAFIISIAISLAPLGWLLISEIFPLNVRGVGMSIGSLAHGGFNAVIAFTFLKLVKSLGIEHTFYLYAFICLVGLEWGYYYIPETKGKSLEDIENFWRTGGPARKL